jgi:hypothetical protein
MVLRAQVCGRVGRRRELFSEYGPCENMGRQFFPARLRSTLPGRQASRAPGGRRRGDPGAGPGYPGL